MSNLRLLDKCREFIVADMTEQSLDETIKDALVSANREIFEIDGFTPLAWARETYDELFTRAYAEISAITAANPGVVTAESIDSDLSDDHGFQTNDVVNIRGIDGMDRLNNRAFLATRASDTTLTFTQLDGTNAINTTNYDDYSAGGTVYHSGLILPKTSIEPTSTQIETADYRWTIKRIWDVTFSGFPTDPMSEEYIRSFVNGWPGTGRPEYWRYQKYYRGDPTSYSHILHWLGFPTAKHNIQIHIEKDYPDLQTWTDAVYPPHPIEIHDFIWHRALANMATNAERQKRESSTGKWMGQVEVLYAQMWAQKAKEDTATIKKISRSMIGDMPSYGGSGA